MRERRQLSLVAAGESSGTVDNANATRKPHVRIDFLEPIRGFAVFVVFAYHAYRKAVHEQPLFDWNGWLPDFSNRASYMPLFLPVNLGVAGVAIFFVVSGFCIHLSHKRRATQDPTFRDFFWRRITRIYPPYLVALLLFAFVYPFGVDFSGGKNILNFLSHLFMFHNFFELEIFAGINPSFWSVAVEAQLYLLYPLLFLVAHKRGWRKCLVGCGVIEILIRTAAAVAVARGTPLPRAIVYSPFAFLLSWGIGAAIADAYLEKTPLPLARQNFWFWMVCCLITPHVLPLTRFNFLVVAITSGVFISRTLNGDRLLPTFPGSPVIGRHLALAGTVSYSLYLFHQPLVNRVGLIASRLLRTELHPLVVMAITLATWPAMVALSWVLYRCLEVPSIAIRSRRSAG